MESKNYGFSEISKLFLGRKRKRQAAFSPLGYLRGYEGVQKYVRERPRTRTGAVVRSGSLGRKVFEPPQEHGSY